MLLLVTAFAIYAAVTHNYPLGFSNPFKILGNVAGEKLTIQYNQRKVIDLPLTVLSDTWRKAIPSRLEK